MNLIEHEFSDNVDISEDSQVPFQEFSELSEELYSIFSPLRTWTSLSSFVSLFESLDKTCIVDDSEDLMASICVTKIDKVILDPDLNPESHLLNFDLCIANPSCTSVSTSSSPAILPFFHSTEARPPGSIVSPDLPRDA